MNDTRELLELAGLYAEGMASQEQIDRLQAALRANANFRGWSKTVQERVSGLSIQVSTFRSHLTNRH